MMRMKQIVSGFLAAAMMTLSVPAGSLYAQESSQQIPSPVLEVSFDEGNANDKTANGNNGNIVGSPEFVAGVKGQAIHLVNKEAEGQPAQQYVDFGTPEELQFGTENFTVMFWYKSDGDLNKEGSIISNKDWVTGDNVGFNIGDMAQGVNWNFNTVGHSGRAETDRFGSATDGSWRHITAVVDRTDAKRITLYIDAKEATGGTGRFGSRTYYADISDFTGSVDFKNFILGADGVKKRGVADSYIDELKVYKTALAKDQIVTVFETEKIRIPIPDPVLEVSFDEENANDKTAHGNHGSLVGSPEFVKGVQGKAIHLVNKEAEGQPAQQYVDFGIPEELQFGTGDFTFMFWYKSDGSLRKEGSIISNKDWDTGDNVGFNMGDMVEGVNLNFNTVGHSGRAETDRFKSATDNSWHHITAVIDRTDKKRITLYIDGKEATGETGRFGSKTYYADISNFTGSVDFKNFVLGADGMKKYGVEDSYIDELKVYKAALVKDQIQDAIELQNIHIRIQKMEDSIAKLTVGSRFTQQAIDTMKSDIETAKLELAQTENLGEMKGILNRLNERFETFMEGAPANMSFHLVADTHITSSATNTPANIFTAALKDMKTINPAASAFVALGDNTQDGKSEEVSTFYQLLGNNNPVENDQTMIVLGNHDVRGPSSTGHWDSFPVKENPYWKTAYNLYMSNNQKYMPDTKNKTYYDRWINGYHLIVLNPENSAKDTAWMTEEQLTWLDEKLAENADPARPAFVFIHQALNDTHWRSNVYNGFGPQDAKVKEILQKYPQTILASGHIHNGFGVAEVVSRPYGTLVEVPSLNQTELGVTENGTGYEVYLYDDEVVFRARNFATSKWIPEYDISIKLNSLPTLTKQAQELQEEQYTPDSWNAAKPVIDNVLKEADIVLNQQYDQSYLTGGGNVMPPAHLYNPEVLAKIESMQKTLQGAFSQLIKDIELPSSPANVRVEDITQNSAKVRWDASSDNVGVIGYEVSLNGTLLGKTTDTFFDLEGLDKATSYTVNIKAYDVAGNYSLSTGKIFVTEDEIIVNKAVVSGTVTNQNGDPLSGAAVTISISDQLSPVTVFTDDQGNYSFTEIPYGSYTISVNMEGYRAESITITVDAAVVTADFVLNKKSTVLNTEILEYTIELANLAKADGALDGVVETVRDNFNRALEKAEEIFENAVSENPTVTQDDIDNAQKKLLEAMHYLEFKGDKTDLIALLRLVQKYVADKNAYIPSTYAPFEKALIVAQAVADDADALDEEIVATWRALLKATSELRLIPDKDKLENLKAQAEALDLSLYTADSAANLRYALAKATAVLNDPEASKATVLEAEQALTNALANLSLIGDQSKPNNGAIANTATTGVGSANNTKTSDNTQIALMFALAAVSGIAVLALRRRKDA